MAAAAAYKADAGREQCTALPGDQRERGKGAGLSVPRAGGAGGGERQDAGGAGRGAL